MNIFEHPRYRLTVTLLKFIGIWPYQSKLSSMLCRSIYLFSIVSAVTPPVYRCLREPTDEILLAFFPPLMVNIIAIIKAGNNIVQSKKLKKLLCLIQEEWNTLTEGPVLDIMTRSANLGGKISIYYAVLYYSSLIIYALIPMRPAMMVWLGLKQGPAQHVFPYFVDYFVDSDEYFFAIEFHIIICAMFVVTVLVANETLLVVFVQHACSLFSTISYRLEHLIDENDHRNYWNAVKTEDSGFAVISDCIKKHNQAIEFTELIEAAYSWSLFFGIGVNTLLMAVTGIQAMAVLDNVDEMLRFIPFFVSEMILILLVTLIFQQLMDYSQQINTSICMAKWYNLSMRSQKLLRMMSMRSQIACKMTAGNLFTLSLEFFVTILKTSASYFTLLNSVREPNE